MIKNHILFIDNIGLFSTTDNINKILKNIDTMGWDYESTVAANLLITDEVLTVVNYFGRFLCILQIAPDQTKGVMIFIDYKQFEDLDHFTINIKPNFIGRLREMLIEKYIEVQSNFLPFMDDVELQAD